MSKIHNFALVHKLKFSIILFFCLFIYESGFPQEIGGYADNYLGLRFSNPKDNSTTRSRFRLQPTFSNNNFIQYSDFDLRYYYGVRNDSITVTIREAYLDYFEENWDIRIGKQQANWGKTFSSASNQLFNQLTGTEFVTNNINELYAGFLGIKLGYFTNQFSIDVLLSPIWARPQIPNQNSRWFFAIPIDLPLPAEYDFSNNQNTINFHSAIRLSFKPSSSIDASFYVFNWTVNQPSFQKSFEINLLNNRFLLSETYSKSWGIGSATEIRLSENHRLKFDLVYWNKRYVDWLPQRIRDLNFENPTIPQLLNLVQVIQEESQVADGFLREKPWIQWVAAYNWEWNGWNGNHEVLMDQILNYEKDIQQIEYFFAFTNVLNKSFWDTFQFTTAHSYNLAGGDSYWSNQIENTFLDNFKISIGTHLFLGKTPDLYYPYFNFAAFETQSFWFIKTKYFF